MLVSRVPLALRERLGSEGMDGLRDVLEQQEEWVAGVLTASLDRSDQRLSGEVSSMRAELGTFRAELRECVAGVEQAVHQLRVELHQQRFDMVKWMFLFWAGQVVALAGLVAAMGRGGQ